MRSRGRPERTGDSIVPTSARVRGRNRRPPSAGQAFRVCILPSASHGCGIAHGNRGTAATAQYRLEQYPSPLFPLRTPRVGA